MMDFNGHLSTGGWIFSVLGMLILLVLVVGLLVVLASGFRKRRSEEPPDSESPQQILDRRLASGELTPDQYQRLRETIGHDLDAANAPPRARAGTPS